MRQLPYERFFYDSEAKKILEGFKPRDMDDKWFIYAQDGWVYFIRSWQGKYIFGLKLDGSPAGVRITNCWVNANKEEYNSQSQEAEIALINNIIESHLLKT